MSDQVNARPRGWDKAESPFHPGEVAIQAKLGVAEKMDTQGRRAVRAYMPEQHRAFFAQLPFVLVGAADAAGQPWATILAAPAGFLETPDATTLRVAAVPGAGDPLAGALVPGAEVGLLGIELPTRRRNRLNGRVTAADAEGWSLTVGQSFGNCPQYIQTRDARFVERAPGPVVDAAALSDADRALIAAADTLFIATANLGEAGPGRGADVSHRGGRPGFVRADDDGTLTMPDFVGNFLFNTLGNLAVEPRAGLLFVDWATGDLLHVAGVADVIWDGPEVRAFAGAERLLRVRVTAVRRRPKALGLAFSEPGYSPLLGRTGDWDAAERAAAAERDRDAWRPFRVARVADESAAVRSFVLEPADGGGVAPHAPGQHLPIRVALPDGAVVRTYTISDAPNGATYRISVKRETGVSRWLHERAAAGTVIEALAPRGSFVFDTSSRRPAVLISAGVGITPMIAMLNTLLVNDGRSRHHAPIVFVHGARNGREHAFARHLSEMAARHPNLTTHVRYSAPDAGDAPDSVGRVDVALLKTLLGFGDYDFYLCGPGGFMRDLYDGLRALNVADDRIRMESFGPSGVVRTKAATEAGDGERTEVVFAKSGKRAFWTPKDGTLLEFAEARGLAPAHSCRAGMCGTCSTRVIAGGVAYAEAPVADQVLGEALICCATPRPGPHLEGSADREGVTLDL